MEAEAGRIPIWVRWGERRLVTPGTDHDRCLPRLVPAVRRPGRAVDLAVVGSPTGARALRHHGGLGGAGRPVHGGRRDELRYAWAGGLSRRPGRRSRPTRHDRRDVRGGCYGRRPGCGQQAREFVDTHRPAGRRLPDRTVTVQGGQRRGVQAESATPRRADRRPRCRSRSASRNAVTARPAPASSPAMARALRSTAPEGRGSATEAPEVDVVEDLDHPRLRQVPLEEFAAGAGAARSSGNVPSRCG